MIDANEVWKYTGNGLDYLPGVPKRDLTNDEFEALDADTQEAAIALGLYSHDFEIAEIVEIIEEVDEAADQVDDVDPEKPKKDKKQK